MRIRDFINWTLYSALLHYDGRCNAEDRHDWRCNGGSRRVNACSPFRARMRTPLRGHSFDLSYTYLTVLMLARVGRSHEKSCVQCTSRQDNNPKLHIVTVIKNDVQGSQCRQLMTFVILTYLIYSRGITIFSMYADKSLQPASSHMLLLLWEINLFVRTQRATFAFVAVAFSPRRAVFVARQLCSPRVKYVMVRYWLINNIFDYLINNIFVVG